MESALRGAADDADLRLIETSRWDGQSCPLIERHLARLAKGAHALGWRADMEAARAALRGEPGVPARLRLLLGRDGVPVVTRDALPRPIPIWRLGLSTERLASTDPWLRIKSTRRDIYEAARSELRAGLDEAILLNERDEVCDGSITTLFFDRGAGLRTPPLRCGVLPGVLRAELLGRGACEEEVLTAGDLPHVRLWIGNALRGLNRATWVAE